MEQDTLTPPSTANDVFLEKLFEIRLKGFQDTDETPSSATTSLPTPFDPEHLRSSLAVAEPAQWSHTLDEENTPVPPAPLIKDYDTFTEGTRSGSFDFLSGDLLEGDILVADPLPLDSESLGSLPVDDPNRSIEHWIDDVSAAYTSHPVANVFPEMTTVPDADPPFVKRPRSIASDDDHRRIRVRTLSGSRLHTQAPLTPLTPVIPTRNIQSASMKRPRSIVSNDEHVRTRLRISSAPHIYFPVPPRTTSDTIPASFRHPTPSLVHTRASSTPPHVE